MSTFLENLISFFADFEHELTREAAPGVMEQSKRDVRKLLDLFKGWSNCRFDLYEGDFSEGMPTSVAGSHTKHSTILRPSNIYSLVFNFGDHAEIVINTMQDEKGEHVVNFCHRRFFIIKEAFHIILRDQYIRNGTSHPDNNTSEELQSAIERLIYLPFSILDLDNPAYPESERVENAAELIALLMLYPLDNIANDRSAFLRLLGASSFEDKNVMIASTRPYAEIYKIPERYVDLIFRWSRFEYLYDLYCVARSKL